jgi:hypothetical protein
MNGRALFLILTFLLVSLPLAAEEWFEVEIRIMTTGENQSQREVGVFGAEIPLSGKGYLEKSLAINNATRGKSNEVDFKISMKPERGEKNELHLIFTSTATPRNGKVENRFRDLRYDNPANQIVEIFSDPDTGTHILVALTLKTKEIKKEMTSDLRVLLKSRLEKVGENGKELIDSFELQSVGDTPVSRSMTHSVPVWVPGAATGEPKVLAPGLKDLDSATAPMAVKAGEGFTYTPKSSKKSDAVEKKKKKKDSRIPAMYQQDKEEGGEEQAEKPEAKAEVPVPAEKPPENAVGSYNWEKEDFSFEVKCEAEAGATVKAIISMKGSLYDQQVKTLKLFDTKEEAHTFSNGEMATFSLLDDAGTGYILTIQAVF